MSGVPLHLNMPSDPAWRRAVVGRLDFDAAIQVHGSLAVLVIAERFYRQRKQCGPLFGEHRRDLPLGGSMNAGVGPALLPAVQISLCVFQALEALSFEWSLLCMSDTGLDFAFPIRVLHSARKGCDTVVLQHVTVQRIERGLINVWREHALAQIIEHHHASGPASPAKRLLMQLGPDTRTGTEHQKANGLPAVSQRQNEQSSAPILAVLRIAHHRAGAVINLGLLTGSGFNHHAGFWRRRSAQLPHKAFHAGVFFAEAITVHQVLPNRHGIAALGQCSFDELAVRFAGARRQAGTRRTGVVSGTILVSRVGGRLCGRFWLSASPTAWQPERNAGSSQIACDRFTPNVEGSFNAP